MPRLTLARCLFLAAAVSGIVYATFGPKRPLKGGGEDVAVALHLARTGVFGHPYTQTIDTGPTAVVPPLYPATLALLVRLGGNSGAWLVLAASFVLVQGFLASLLPRVSSVFYGDPRPGIYAAVLSIMLPVYSWMPYWDAVYTAAGLMLFCLASRKLLESRRLLAPFACGLMAGLLALLNPASTMVSIPWMIFLLAGRRDSLPGWSRIALAFLAALALTVLPWSLRNYRLFGTLSLKGNLGTVLYMSNNGCASSAFVNTLNSGCHDLYHPSRSLAEAELAKRLGEGAYDRYRMETATHWIRNHPAPFLRLTAHRILEFWFPNPAYGLYGYSIWLVTALSVPGLWLMYRVRLRALQFIAAVFFLYPWLYYAIVSDYRHRYPILWLSLLPAGYAIATLVDRIGTPNLRGRLHRRIAARFNMTSPAFESLPGRAKD